MPQSQVTVGPVFLSGDVLSHRGGALLPRFIRFFQTDEEEKRRQEKTFSNHSSQIGKPGTIETATIIEANSGGVREIPMVVGIRGEVEVWRHVTVEGSPPLQEELSVIARRRVGTGYPYAKLGLHALDWAATRLLPFKEVTVFRRLGGLISKRPVCSVFVARNYREVFIDNFGKPNPSLVQPDDIHDWVKKSTYWRLIARYKDGQLAVC